MSHGSNWTRRPAYPQVRLGEGQSVEFLVAGDAWSFELPSKHDRFASVRHLANVVLKEHLTDPFVRSCWLLELNDTTFRAIVTDPTTHWMRLTRLGVGKANTRYRVETVRAASDGERQLASLKIKLDLELAASDKQSKSARTP
jgi:hypothetical protein